jgi:perosamine synthetase
MRLQVIPVHAPVLGAPEINALATCVAAGDASGHSPTVKAFEAAFASRSESRHAMAVSSGTTSLHLVFAALDFGPGDEVVVPSFSFAPCADMVALTGARVVFADADPDSYAITADTVRAVLTPRTRAVLAVHLFGHPCDLTSLRALCDAENLALIEDCAQGLGAVHAGSPVGNAGLAACYSFYANKVVTTGEGGMVTTGDPRLATRLASLRSHAAVGDPRRPYLHSETAFNYRMSAFAAAVGLAQLDRLDGFLERKASNAACYDERLGGCEWLRTPTSVPAGDRHAHWAYAVLAEDEGAATSLRAHLADCGIETRGFYHPLHLHPPSVAAGSGGPGSLPVCEAFAPRGVVLPSGNGLTATEVDTVCDAIAKW